MLGNCRINPQGQLKRCVSVFSRYDRLAAPADAFEKGFDLETQWLALRYLRFLHTEARGNRFHRRTITSPGRHVNEQKILPGIIDRDVLVRLEEAQLANPFGADPTGGEVGDAARLEFDPDVCDIDFWRENRQPDRMHLANGGLSEGEDDVEIMDHQVEHNIHVKRTGAEDTEPVRLKEHGSIQ